MKLGRSILSGVVLLLSTSLGFAQETSCFGRVTVYLDAPNSSGGRLEFGIGARNPFEISVTARIRAELEDDGFLTYSISVMHDADVLYLVDATSDGTDSDDMRGFKLTNVVDNETGTGFISVLVSDFGVVVSPVPAPDFSITRADYELVAPLPASLKAAAPVGDTTIETRIEFINGLRGQGQPVGNYVQYLGETRVPCTESLEIAWTFPRPGFFFRGDANADHRFDISDPVTILRHQFHGDAEIHCDDAADTNDDGTLDISDATFAFNYLFRGGPPPSEPFPEEGYDPTDDTLGCHD